MAISISPRPILMVHMLGLMVVYLNILPLRVPEWRVMMFPPWEANVDLEELDKCYPGAPSYDDHQAEILVKRAAGSEIIDDRFTPVMIFAEDRFISLGTLLKSRPGREIVIAPAHNFDEEVKRHYSFQALIPIGTEKKPINRVLKAPDAHVDFAICVAGEPEGIGKLIDFDLLNYEGSWHLERHLKMELRSLLDGRKITSDAIITNLGPRGRRTNTAIPLPRIIGPGECGMPFVDESGNLYHLVSSIELTASNVKVARDEGIVVPYSADMFVGLEAVALDRCFYVNENGEFELSPESEMDQKTTWRTVVD